MYGGGKCEEFIGKCEIAHSKEMKIATKANPWDDNTLSPEGIRSQLETSLKRLQVGMELQFIHR